MKMQLVSFFKYNHCSHCNEDDCLDFIDEYGNHISLDTIRNNLSILDRCNSLDHIECNKCKIKYYIDWTEGGIPKPMITDFAYSKFISKI